MSYSQNKPNIAGYADSSSEFLDITAEISKVAEFSHIIAAA